MAKTNSDRIKAELLKSGQIILIIMGLAGCKSYLIPVDSFKAQFNGIDSTKMQIVNTRGPAGDIASYPANPIDYIQCIDRKNNPFQLKNSPSIEIRVTDDTKKRTVFYFDTVYLQDSTISGDRSRFFEYRKEIPIGNIRLIEVQDGHKNFKYLDKK